MTISVVVNDSPVSVTVGASGGTVSVSAATAIGVSVGIGDTTVPAPHAGTHAVGGSDPISGSMILAGVGVTDTFNEDDTVKIALEALDIQKSSVAHGHGLLTSDGKIGTASGLVVTTGSGGALQASDKIAAERLPLATTTAAGAITVGSGLSIAGGILSATGGGGGAAAGVASINGLTGTVTLTAASITAASASHTHAADDIISGTIASGRLPLATASVVGAVSAGTGLSVSGGTLSANVISVNGKTGTVSLSATDVTAAASSHTHAADDIISGTIASDRLGSGTANSGTYLRGDQTWSSVDIVGGVSGQTVSPSAVTAASLGTASAPAYSFSSDTDTGVYSSGANTLDMATGGTGRIKVNSAAVYCTNGFVAGSATDLGNYVTAGAHQTQFIAPDGVSRTPLVVVGGDAGVQLWQDSSPSKAALFGLGIPGQAADGNFYVSLFASSWATRFTILNASGNVGIGTTSPGSKLDVNGNVNVTGNVTASGSISGKIGTTSGQIVVTTTGGSLTTAATIAASTQVSGLSAIATSGSASDLASGTVPTARLGSGTASASTYLRGDQTWATVSGGGSSSASDLTSGTLADARLSDKALASINHYLWSTFR